MRDIEQAIKAGELNRDTMVLVRNWCAHAEKFGGTGLIEAQTGLPIGHHSMQCDFAPAGGMACWDMREAVIDFYDANCAGCMHRKPVRLPNISEIIGERDRARAIRQEAEAAADREATEALAIRKTKRAVLKPQLAPIAQTLLDDIDAFDEDRSTENFERVTHSARLAPDHFSSALVEYVFDLAMDQPWFRDAGLVILDAVDAEDSKIASIALAALEHGYPVDIAAEKLLPRLEHVEAPDVQKILRSAIDLSWPDRELHLFRGDGEPWPERRPELVEGLYRLHGKPVLQELEALLLSGRRSAVERAGRGLQALQQSHPSAGRQILRTVVSVYVRADSLVGDLKAEGDRLPDLADALNACFEDDPNGVDALLQEFAAGASTDQRVRIYKVYALALHVRYNAPPVAAGSEPHNVALSRLVWAPTIERDSAILDELRSGFRPSPDGVVAIIRTQLDSFVGALFLMADRLAEFDATPNPPNDNWLMAMERRNQRMTLVQIMEEYVEWASASGVGDELSLHKIVAMFDEIPEDRDELRGMLLGATKKLAEDLSGLKQVLPHLYHALVGPSVLGRSYAAGAVGELPYRAHDNVPDLLFEAFCALLWDQYVVVHKSAVRAFRRAHVPEAYRKWAAHAIYNLVQYYRVQSHEDDFLADCVQLLAGMVDLFGAQSGALRSYLIEVSLGIEPVFLRSEVVSLSYTLGEDPAFAKLVARMLPEMSDRFNQSDEAIQLLHKLSPEAVKTHAALLDAAALEIVDDDLQLALGIVEAFLRAGDLTQAIETSVALQAQIGDTVRTRARRTAVVWPALAARFEMAVMAGDDDQIGSIAKEWADLAAADDEDKKDRRERRSRSRFSLPD